MSIYQLLFFSVHSSIAPITEGFYQGKKEDITEYLDRKYSGGFSINLKFTPPGAELRKINVKKITKKICDVETPIQAIQRSIEMNIDINDRRLKEALRRSREINRRNLKKAKR